MVVLARPRTEMLCGNCHEIMQYESEYALQRIDELLTKSIELLEYIDDQNKWYWNVRNPLIKLGNLESMWRDRKTFGTYDTMSYWLPSAIEDLHGQLDRRHESHWLKPKGMEALRNLEEVHKIWYENWKGE